MNQFLIIQTAFIGDVILATAVAEKLHCFYPNAKIDFLVRKGNEGLLHEHPFIRNVLLWEKKGKGFPAKYFHLLKLALSVRSKRYDCVINLHRFLSSGLITAFSGAKNKYGFDKNPCSFSYTHIAKHEIGEKGAGLHEVQRNQKLIAPLTDDSFAKPALYPSQKDFEKVKLFKKGIGGTGGAYICISPASVWFTKQFPAEKWVQLIEQLRSYRIYLTGGSDDNALCEQINQKTIHPDVRNIAGKLSFLELAALMKDASMNFVNDSAPLHIASAMNAPVTSVFCSTVPRFGFGPLSDRSFVVETKEQLACRPCGLHGYKSCPEKHFRCAMGIEIKQLLVGL